MQSSNYRVGPIDSIDGLVWRAGVLSQKIKEVALLPSMAFYRWKLFCRNDLRVFMLT